MASIEMAREVYSGRINLVEIGATADRGGTRSQSVTIGGRTTLPSLFGEGRIPNPPVVALEVVDMPPQEWPEGLIKAWDVDLADPLEAARFAVEKCGVRLLAVTLASVHPDNGNRPVEAAAEFVGKLLKAVKVPLIILGCGDAAKDNDLHVRVSQIAKGERCLLGIASEHNYKTLAASASMDGHALIAESPIDVNIAKQLNILIRDLGFDPARIVMHPTTASLGYGMEYTFSIMERSQIAALGGDAMLSQPFILFPGQEVWRTKEAKDSVEQGIAWELATSVAMLRSGADLLVVRHPKSAEKLSKFIGAMMEQSEAAK